MQQFDLTAIVVDDDEPCALMLSELLESMGCRARPVVRSAEAIEAVTAEAPDFVSLDLTMPDLHGYDVLTLIRSHAYSRGLAAPPVITVTGSVSLETKADALSRGFAAYIAKPVDPTALQAVLPRIAELRRPEYRRKNSADAESIRERVRSVYCEPHGCQSKFILGVALACEQKASAHTCSMLEAALRGRWAEAAAESQRLTELGHAIAAHLLAEYGRQCEQSASRQQADAFEHFAVLARGEVDRVVTTIREMVFD